MDGRLNLVGQIMHVASKEVQRLAGLVTVNQGKQQQHLFYGVINTQAAKTAGTPACYTVYTVQAGTLPSGSGTEASGTLPLAMTKYALYVVCKPKVSFIT